MVMSIRKNSLIIFIAALALACDTAPPPKATSDVQPVQTTARAKIAALSKEPGAVLREKTIQSVAGDELVQPDGKKIKFGDLKGKVVLVDIWATFCGPCRAQAPRLAALDQKYRDKGFMVVGLNIDEVKDRGLVKDFMQEAGITYTVAYPSDSMQRAFMDGTEDGTGYAPIPQLFLISREGKLVEHLIGSDPRHSMADLEEAIAKQL
jgi:thiol-disulfide isomerase/thioredoxin